jgi:hypothetical protein
MSRSDVLLGQYGTIPDDVYLRKIESSNMPEDPMAVENYMRGLLSDFRPDPRSLASDEMRDPDDIGGGTHSTERLSLRHSGGRSEEDPYLPDGTFLDHEFLERDPRSATGEPDWNEARRQKMARAAYIKFYNDDDLSVPETGINPVQMRSLIRNSQQQFKDRYQNFSESFDSWHNGGTVPFPKNSVVAMTLADGSILDLADATAKNRQDAVTVLSNAVKGTPRFTTPDHRVKIARYGRLRPIQDIGANNWNNNRSNAYLDHSIPVEVNGQMVNKLLATMIVDLEGQRANKQVAYQGANYADSAVNQQRATSRGQLNPEDVYKLVMIGLSSNSQVNAANTAFEGMSVNRKNQKISDVNTREMLNNAIIGHHIASNMVQGAKPGPKPHRINLRKNITQSAAASGFHTEQGNRKVGHFPTDTDLKREGLDTRHIEESRTVKNYGMAKPLKVNSNGENVSFENFGGTSRSMKVNAKKYGSKRNDVNSNETDTDMKEFGDVARRAVASDEYHGRSINKSEVGDSKFGDSVDFGL